LQLDLTTFYFFGFVGVGAGGRVVTWDVVFCPPF
jgi:hypothetical protein